MHAGRVSTSQHVALSRRRATLPRQRVHAASRSTSTRHPANAQSAGSTITATSSTQFTILTPYTELRVISHSLVEVCRGRRQAGRRSGREPGVGRRARQRASFARTHRRRVAEFRYPSPYVEPAPELADVRAPDRSRRAAAAARGGDRADAPHPRRVPVRPGRDDDHDAGHARARRAARRVPGLRASPDRLPALARPAGALRQRLSADRSAARTAAAGRRRRVARVALGVVSARTAGSISIRPTPCSPTRGTSRSPGAATTATSARSAASSSAARPHELYVGVSVVPVDANSA